MALIKKKKNLIRFLRLSVTCWRLHYVLSIRVTLEIKRCPSRTLNCAKRNTRVLHRPILTLFLCLYFFFVSLSFMCVHNAAACDETYPLLYVVSFIVPVTFISIYRHFCSLSGLTQCNGRCRIDEIAAYRYIS